MEPSEGQRMGHSLQPDSKATPIDPDPGTNQSITQGSNQQTIRQIWSHCGVFIHQRHTEAAHPTCAGLCEMPISITILSDIETKQES